MSWMVIVGCMVSVWAVLRIIGSERDARFAEIESLAKKASKDQTARS
jgi:hypothetical protein